MVEVMKKAEDLCRKAQGNQIDCNEVLQQYYELQAEALEKGGVDGAQRLCALITSILN